MKKIIRLTFDCFLAATGLAAAIIIYFSLPPIGAAEIPPLQSVKYVSAGIGANILLLSSLTLTLVSVSLYKEGKKNKK